VAALLAFTPLGWPLAGQRHSSWSSSSSSHVVAVSDRGLQACWPLCAQLKR
jgi:hypothetical protein